MPVRTQILDAAERVIVQHSTAGFTMVALRKEARLSHTTIYKHFESRDHIVETLAMRWLDGLADELKAYTRTAACDLHGFFALLLQRKTAIAALSPLLFAAFASALHRNRNLEDGWKERLRMIVAEVLRSAGHPVDDSDMDARLDGVMAATIGFRHPVFIEKASQQLLEYQLGAVMKIIMQGLRETQ